ncbi:LysM peptidoglycan-binding domain-containing protein [Brachyspira innocens]|uniref:LysM peptidoglycan-binding domain-containing protein n=1 Tax=Brachyspira innocens TaxID=13264 RepID=A0ABT8YVC9_9SPIR|nr:LysM peptidoglycan-binding domain-containing protein [Brachyspira innocens]MDO6994989.1 LysM peptidoglycan-binding domain-containing protein [Brachyspira innocens]MDO7019868.1 LysM peptidoglycan-binding domain-containing protein [Brachyspira innocens]
MKNVFKYASVIGCTFFSISFGANYIDYKVKNGDTLYGIAFAHDMSASEFLKLNNIKDPNEYKLKVGETLKVKEAGYSLVYDSENKVYGLKGEENKSYKDYKVKNGDSLYGIAFAHGMTANEFLAINNIKDPNKYNLKIGEILKVANNTSSASNNSSNLSPSKDNVSEKNYDTYKVKSGDTLYGIAFAHGMTASEFLKINNIDDPNKYKLYVGKTMYVAKSERAEKENNNNSNIQKEVEYYTVKSGDTLYGIAFQNDISVNEFLKINNIDDPLKYKLRTGEKLKIYAKSSSNAQSKTIKTYKVKYGDTLGEIAVKNSMSLKDLLALNGLKSNYVLKVGDTLKLYDNVSINTSSKPSQYRTLENYKVKSGDTLSEIALARGMDLVELYSLNNINDKYILKIGDTLKVYANSPKTSTLVTSIYKVKSGDTLYSIAKSHKMDLRSLMQLNNIKNANEYKLYVGASIKVQTVKMISYSFNDDSILPESSFIWPYRGIIVSGYGVTSDKLANRGINILGDVGDKVVASDDGIVEYVDNVRGFGTVIILKHKNGYNTSYAHLSKANVKLGDIVSKGEYIGDIGDTGMIDRSELYFKISYQGRAIDPTKLLPRG